jgi:hypothetical protein
MQIAIGVNVDSFRILKILIEAFCKILGGRCGNSETSYSGPGRLAEWPGAKSGRLSRNLGNLLERIEIAGRNHRDRDQTFWGQKKWKYENWVERLVIDIF